MLSFRSPWGTSVHEDTPFACSLPSPRARGGSGVRDFVTIFCNPQIREVSDSKLFQSRTSIRFHPKSRASTDHVPGPSSAKAAPMVPNKMLAHGSAGCEMAFQNPKTATSAPAMGVHKPASKSIPVAIASTSATGSIGGPVRSLMSPEAITLIPAISRSKRRPAPGQPQANVENRRRKTTPCVGYLIEKCGRKPQKGGAGHSFEFCAGSYTGIAERCFEGSQGIHPLDLKSVPTAASR
jgi:hypothetical protein